MPPETTTTMETASGPFPCRSKDCNHPPFETAAGRSSHERSAHKMIDPVAAAKWRARKKVIAKRKAKLAAAETTTAAVARATRFSKQKSDGRNQPVTCGEKNKDGTICRFRHIPKVVGRHKLNVHGIHGTSSSARLKAANKKKLATQPATALVVHGEDDFTCKEPGCKKPGPYKNLFGLNIHKHTHNKGANHNGNGTSTYLDDLAKLTPKEIADEIAIAHSLGRNCTLIEQLLAFDADRIGVHKVDLRQRCLAVLSGTSKALRERYRLPDRVPRFDL